MLEFVSHYIKNIAFFLLFIVFIGIIMPNAKYKKYVDVVLGLILIFVMIQPITNFFSKDESEYEQVLESITKKLDVSNTGIDKEINAGMYDQMVDKNVQFVLKKQMNQLLKEEGVMVKEINVVFDEASGNISTVDLVIEQSEQKDSEENKLIRIEPIRVRTFSSEQREKEEQEMNEETKNIKYIISDFYNLSVDNIHITVHKKN